jgi:hypothetical protein
MLLPFLENTGCDVMLLAELSLNEPTDGIFLQ